MQGCQQPEKVWAESKLNLIDMNMITLLIAVTVGAFLYGFAWHDQPAREHESTKPADRK